MTNYYTPSLEELRGRCGRGENISPIEWVLVLEQLEKAVKSNEVYGQSQRHMIDAIFAALSTLQKQVAHLELISPAYRDPSQH